METINSTRIAAENLALAKRVLAYNPQDIIGQQLAQAVVDAHAALAVAEQQRQQADARSFELLAQVSFVCGTDTTDTLRGARARLVEAKEAARQVGEMCGADADRWAAKYQAAELALAQARQEIQQLKGGKNA